jgi:hypothetical protein
MNTRQTSFEPLPARAGSVNELPMTNFSKAQCSSGKNQSRPFPARSVKRRQVRAIYTRKETRERPRQQRVEGVTAGETALNVCGPTEKRRGASNTSLRLYRADPGRTEQAPFSQNNQMQTTPESKPE